MTSGRLVPSNDLRIVALSIVISILGVYASRYLAERVQVARGRSWVATLLGAATVDGIGTWSMHYTGMLALVLPIPLQFDWRIVFLSLLVGIAGSGAGLFVIGQGKPGWARAVLAGICIGGVAISGLHFTAMAAIRQPRMQHSQSSSSMALSILLAVVISVISLRLQFLDRNDAKNQWARRHSSAFLRGSANPIMHYTAMATVVFSTSGPVDLSHTVSIASVGVVGISLVPLMLLVVALLSSVVDRLQKQRALFDELFEAAPQAVVLMTDEDSIVRVNREFKRMFGYMTPEPIGQRLSDFILPAGSRNNRVLEAEGTRPRSDGTRLHVAVLRVPVPLPGGQVQIYAILRDITEQKKSEETLRTLPRRLIEMQEAERKRIARELHDEIGQVLTGVGMLLSPAEQLPPETQARLTEAQAAVQDLSVRARALALDLSPTTLDDFGLVAALESLLQQYTRQTGITIAFTHAGLDGKRLRAALEIGAYRIVQEALTNIARHARIHHATVTVQRRDDALLLDIEDQGVGFVADLVKPASAGLAGMRERATVLGGQLTVTASPGRGSQVSARLPLCDGEST